MQQLHHSMELEQLADRKDWDALELRAFHKRNLSHLKEREIRFGEILPPSAPGPEKAEDDTILITGAAGFIGSNMTRQLLKKGFRVIGVDDFNDHYDVSYKYLNISEFLLHERYEIHRLDFRDIEPLRGLFYKYNIKQILHLGARAGVRTSIGDPQLYVTTNMLGTQNLLELAREFKVDNFVYASSSSVYGGSETFPLSENHRVDHPISPYAATKKSNEVQAAVYKELFGVPVTGLRFFTVYGPGGRPDMSIRKFMEGLDHGEPITMFGDGSFQRDFTYIDDIVDGILKALEASREKSDWDQVFNLGESRTNSVRRMILYIVTHLGKWSPGKPVTEMTEDETKQEIEKLIEAGLVVKKPVPLGDVPKTFADISKAREMLGYDPKTLLDEGIRKTAEWHLERKKNLSDPFQQIFNESIRTYWNLLNKADLDSSARPKDPFYADDDLRLALKCLAVFETAVESFPEDKLQFLALRLIAWCCELISLIASYLPREEEPKMVGLGRINIHKKRMAIIEMLREAGHARLQEERLDSVLRLSLEIQKQEGERKKAIVVAAAGYGTRVAEQVGGYNQKHKLFLGDEMILLSLRNMTPFADRIVLVVNEHNIGDITERLERSEINEANGFKIDYVIQEHKFGDGDAHLTAKRALADFDGIILFIFADAPTKSPKTIERMLLLKEALGRFAPLVVPCESDENPYSPIVLAPSGPDRGRVLWNWQKADEHDSETAREARRRAGLRNVGIFAAEANVFPALQFFKEKVFYKSPRYQRYKNDYEEWKRGGSDPHAKPKEAEFGFADLMKVLPQSGEEVIAANFALPPDKLNVNSPEDAELVLKMIRRQYPYVKVIIEKIPEKNEIFVKFIDLDDNKIPMMHGGVASLRNCTRFQYPPEMNLDSKDIDRQLAQHIKVLSEKIELELGVKVIMPS